MIRVILAEDHTMMRKGLNALLKDEAGIIVLAEAEDGREAVRLAEALHPDVVLMDLSMPVLNGLEATRQIKQRAPEVKVLVLTMHTTEEYVFQILRAGASGYVVKQAAPEELISAIHTVCQGEVFLSPVISRMVIGEYIQRAESTVKDSYELLTDREREILQLIAEGRSSREIAELWHVSEKTVASHRTHLMEKLDMHNVAELTRYAFRKGVISLDE
ncbi:MAG: response regulator transcription factor [Anaerolineales bacterium]|nr:MAG: response regulator transcription factor [Anaerolineales bacterium]